MEAEESFLNSLPQPLSKEELYDLFKQKDNGSKSARDKLIIHNIKLILYEIIYKFHLCIEENEDLISIGTVGLIKAIDTYDINKGFEFSSYAIKCIDNEIKIYFRKDEKSIKTQSIDDMFFTDKDGDDIKIIDTLGFEDRDYFNIEDEQLNSDIRRLVDKLPFQTRCFIMMYYGFYDDKLYTLQQIADSFNVSKQYVNNTILNAVRRLKKQLEFEKIIEVKTIRKKYS